MDRHRLSLLALALGPCPTQHALRAVNQPEVELQAWWLHREAYGQWPAAESVDALLVRLEKDLRRLSRRGARPVLAGDADYPAAVNRWASAPAVIFVWGGLPAGRSVAVVGSRAAAAGGLEASRCVGRELARAGWCVVSGGAIGIDGAAHEGALEAGGRSVAVLGSGLDHLYPERHRALFERLAAQGGVLSPFAPSARPRRWQFPRRNDVMARLACLVVVVEASTASGALITARLARAAGVPVLARPGSPGTDRLLGSGAGLVESPDDVLRVLRGEPARRRLEPQDPDAACALVTLRGHDALSLDELALELRWAAARAAVALMRLQLEGFVELLPGGRYRGNGSSQW